MTDWLVRIKSRSTDGNLGNPDTAVISFKYARPDSLPDGQTFEHLDRSNLDSKRIAKLERALESAKARIADFEHRPDTAISGRVFANLLRAIAAFPTRYPQYSERFPKLDSDVRPWLKESGIATNDREAHVFSSILSEHFATSPDTLKP